MPPKAEIRKDMKAVKDEDGQRVYSDEDIENFIEAWSNAPAQVDIEEQVDAIIPVKRSLKRRQTAGRRRRRRHRKTRKSCGRRCKRKRTRRRRRRVSRRKRR